ncbi:MAG: L-aspartate oxidase [Firmicutes bacterium]|nr:L-aspartate oxidase [Bacillota bacterium]MDI6704899.1 L-aspartate oxidase [Bacillota bacterium]
MDFVANFSTFGLEKEQHDVVIVGSGIAGLYTALNLRKDLRVAVISKNSLSENNTCLAQGGIAVAMKEEDRTLHVADTMKAGSWINNREAVQVMVAEALENITATTKMGVEYDRDEEGNLLSTLEGGHSSRRIVHAGGDATGREVHRVLLAALLSRENTAVMDNAFAVDLLVRDGRCCGILVQIEGGKRVLYCKALVLATGGIGQIYCDTTNSPISTGDGLAMAFRAGMVLKDMEFVQFHPTTLYSKEYKKRHGRGFLISEAVRGEGAALINKEGRRIMEGVHPRKELAPRDVVARTMFEEMSREQADCLYLDITHRDREFLAGRFPTIYNTCLSIGLDISRDYIPVTPAAHYMIGGIPVDLDGRTCISCLYACGECSCTGVHGANRLASNSLLEGLVFGRRIATDINRIVDRLDIMPTDFEYDRCTGSSSRDWNVIRERIGNIMTEKAGIIRSRTGITEAVSELDEIWWELRNKDCVSPAQMETKNMLHGAMQIARAAARRGESCGTHYITS